MSWSLPPVPDHWATTTLDQIAEIQSGITLGKKRKPSDYLRSIPYLRVANVQRGQLDLTEVKEVEATESEIEALRLQPGDLLMNEGGDRDKLGRGWVWEGELDECIHQNHVFRIRLASPEIVPEYVSHFANTVGADYFSYVGKHTTGLASINRTKLSALPVALPPSNEQRRIVARLEELTSRTRAARDTLEALPPLLDRFRQSVLAAAFRGDLTADWRARNPDVEPASELLKRIRLERRRRWEEAELEKMRAKGKVPEDDRWKAKFPEVETAAPCCLPPLPPTWAWARAQELSSTLIASGNTPDRGLMYAGIGQVPFVKVYNLTFDGHLDFTKDPTFIDAETHVNVLSRSHLLPGDVLMNIVGPPLGKVSIVPDTYPEWNMNQAIVSFRPVPPLNNRLLCYALLTDATLAWLFDESKATAGQYNVRATACRIMPIPLPPLEEQAVMLERLSASLDASKDVRSRLASCSSHLTTLHQSLLAKAFRGELVPQDPDDEPASVLLERIRKEREAAGGNGTRKLIRRSR